MSETKMISIPENELESLLARVCRKAIREAFAEQEDEFLNIKQICDRISGLSWYTFKNLAKEKNLVSINGKYSLKAVKDAMRSE